MSQIPSNDGFTYSTPPSKGMAVTSLILGILGCIPFVGIVAVILGIIAMRRAKADPQRFGGSGLALGGIICGGVMTVAACAVFGIAGVLLPALGQARSAARHLKSQSQLSQIGMALHTYAMDNKEAFPETDSDWQDRLVPAYVPSAGVFGIPGSDAANPAKYIYIPGYVMNKLQDPSRTVLVYESSTNPWKNRVALLYADGHVGDVTADQVPSILAGGDKPASAKPAPTKPKPSGN